MNKRCDGCVHWNDDDNADIKGMGVCTKAMPFWDATEWVKGEEYITRTVVDKYKDQMLFAQDGSDYRATVITRADFYCAHHEASGP